MKKIIRITILSTNFTGVESEMEFGTKEKKVSCLVYEAIGTGFVSMSCMLGVFENGYPFVLMNMIWMIIADSVTGGHFNPAITLCMWLSSKKLKENAPVMLFMIVGQAIGIFIGVLFTWLAMCDYGYMKSVTFGNAKTKASIPWPYVT